MKKMLPLIIAPFAGIIIGVLLALLYLIKISWEIIQLISFGIKVKFQPIFKNPQCIGIPKSQIYFLFFTLFSISLFAQSPQAFKWQGVVRNDQMEVLANQTVSIRFSILEDHENGGSVYIEEHSATTNELGLLSLNLGKGTFLDGSFTAIPWGTKPHFLKVEIDVTGRSNYGFMGTSEVFLNNGGSPIINTNNWIKKDGILTANHDVKIETILTVEETISSGSRIFVGRNGTESGYSLLHFKNGTNTRGGVIRASKGDEDNANAPLLYQAKNHTFAGQTNIHASAVGLPYSSGNILNLVSNNAAGALTLGKLNQGGDSYIQSSTTQNSSRLVLNPHGGIIVVPILEITGGSDITERVNSFVDTEPGEVVIIDATSPNHVKKSTKAYDKTVIGVVSGAGGVKSGMELKQEGLLDGNTSFAIAGRVYVKVTGKVKPGDLLTTSNVSGYAMVAKRKKRSRGAIIGKALSSNITGKGQVLMLVNIQ